MGFDLKSWNAASKNVWSRQALATLQDACYCPRGELKLILFTQAAWEGIYASDHNEKCVTRFIYSHVKRTWKFRRDA